GGHDQDRAIHLGGAGDHVLDVIGVAGAIDVGIVPVGGFVLDVSDGDRDTAGLLFRRVIDGVETAEFDFGVVLCEHFGDGRGQGGLAVVDVADRADIHVRLAAVKFFLCHD